MLRRFQRDLLCGAAFGASAVFHSLPNHFSIEATVDFGYQLVISIMATGSRFQH